MKLGDWHYKNCQKDLFSFNILLILKIRLIRVQTKCTTPAHLNPTTAAQRKANGGAAATQMRQPLLFSQKTVSFLWVLII
jgi:hypothetical protein